MIEQQGWTPEQWVNGISKGKNQQSPRDLKFDGKGLLALGALFGITGNPVSNLLPRLQLGACIWPDAEVIQQELKKYTPKQ